MKKIIVLLVVFFLAIGQICCEQVSTVSFKSADLLIQYFVDSIKNGDIDKALATSAYNNDPIVEKINAKEFIKRMQAITPSSPKNLPSAYHSIIKLNLLAEYASQIRMLISSLLLPDDFNDLIEYRSVMFIDNDKLIDIYMSSLNLSNLSSLELVRIDITNPDLQFGEWHKSAIENQKLIYGFDEQIEYTALYKLNDKYYSGGFTAVRYESNWYISKLSASLGGANINGSLVQISGVEEYLYSIKY